MKLQRAARVEGLSKMYEVAGGVVHTPRDVTLEVPEGDLLAIMGPSSTNRGPDAAGAADKRRASHGGPPTNRAREPPLAARAHSPIRWGKDWNQRTMRVILGKRAGGWREACERRFPPRLCVVRWARAPPPEGSFPEFIGRRSGDHFQGLLDDVAIWDRALDPGEVAFLYNGGLGNPANELGDTGGSLTFSVDGNVPPGATIDAETGVFTWTAPPTPVSYAFIVRVTDDGVPRMSDEEAIAVIVTTTCPADLNANSEVNIVDFLLMVAAWSATPLGPPDLNGDGIVDASDLLLLLDAWGSCPSSSPDG